MTQDISKSPYIAIGVIGAAHGVRGDLKVKSFTEHPEDLLSYTPLYLGEGSREVHIRKVLTSQGDKLTVHFEGIEDRTQAEHLKGQHIMIRRDQLLPLEDEETYYHSDLLGLEARLPHGDVVGTVVAVNDFGAGDLLEIKSQEGKMLTVAFTKAGVPEVNLKDGYLVIVLEALLDIQEDR